VVDGEVTGLYAEIQDDLGTDLHYLEHPDEDKGYSYYHLED
jgi:hypothetical protein